MRSGTGGRDTPVKSSVRSSNAAGPHHPTRQVTVPRKTTACGPIDTSFDVRTDTPAGKDPDSHSPALRCYHQTLRSKPLRYGTPFTFSTARTDRYLHHASARGEFVLTSDSVIQCCRTWERMARIMAHVPAAELDEFQRLGYSIGGMMVFPAPAAPACTPSTASAGSSALSATAWTSRSSASASTARAAPAP